MGRDEVLARVKRLVLTVNGNLTEGELTEDRSLITHLGLDSLQLAKLVAALREQLLDVSYLPWIVEAADQGRDTLGSLVDFVFREVRR
jgi:aryl carrier-like protein